MVAESSIVIFGAGSVGGYLGAKLAHSAAEPADINLVGRRPLIEAVNRRGLILRSGEDELITYPSARESIGDLGPAALIVLSVRGYDVPASIPSIQRIFGGDSILLAVQNGVGSEKPLFEAFPKGRVLIGTLTTSVSMDAPGVVTLNGNKGGLALAPGSNLEVPSSLIQLLADAGLPPQIIRDYRSLRWSKLLLNLPGTATTAVLDSEMETVMSNPSLFRLERAAFLEAARVMEKQNIPVVGLPDYPAPLMKRAMSLPSLFARRLIAPRLIRSRGGRAPTMREDLKKGRTEVDFLNGAVVREASRIGEPAPANAALAELIQELSQNPELRNDYRANPNALVSSLSGRGLRF